MKRTITLLLSVTVLMGLLVLPMEAQAASASVSAGMVSTSGSRLNVRSRASTGGSVVATIRNGGYVTLISKSGSWWYVEYANGRYGYCHGDYIKSVSAASATVSTRSGALNVRSGAGTSYSKIASLPKGETVIVLSSSGGWSRILFHGTKTGYVSAAYLSSSTAGDPAVSLAVPSFKQNDSRWASVTIGSSGKTIAQIGCTTTAIAMMESYRTGTTIYPDAMSKRLSYTASGNVYWPSDYTAVTDSSGYLQAFYDLLRQGKPILFGAKTSGGKQHWVVVTGFTGGSLTASAFTIHDPGTNSRTNLQQFLNAYPVFYKYFYYS